MGAGGKRQATPCKAHAPWTTNVGVRLEMALAMEQRGSTVSILTVDKPQTTAARVKLNLKQKAPTGAKRLAGRANQSHPTR